MAMATVCGSLVMAPQPIAHQLSSLSLDDCGSGMQLVLAKKRIHKVTVVSVAHASRNLLQFYFYFQFRMEIQPWHGILKCHRKKKNFKWFPVVLVFYVLILGIHSAHPRSLFNL